MAAPPQQVARRASVLAALLLLLARTSQAEDEPTTTQLTWQLEAGSEVDSNPGRIESTTDEAVVEPALVARAASRFSLTWRPRADRVLTLDATAAAKKYTGSESAIEEDVIIAMGDLRYTHRLGKRRAALTARLNYYDAFERDTFTADNAGRLRNRDRDFRTGSASLALRLHSDDNDRVTATFGYRFFRYKANPALNFQGERLALTYERQFLTGLSTDDTPPSVGLNVGYSLNRRYYNSAAYDNLCSDERAADPLCWREIRNLSRVDMFHAVSGEVGYSGDWLAALRYELHVNASNSFGESLLRHRFSLTATTELFADIFMTARVIVQLTAFLDPLLISGDVGTFFTIEDESRNALSVHLSREISAHWQLEGRFSIYSNELAKNALTFRRQTLYLGAVYRM